MFYCILDRINFTLVSKRDKTKFLLTPNFEQQCKSEWILLDLCWNIANEVKTEDI